MTAGAASQAQVQKGDWLLGGTFSFYTSSSNNGSTTNTGSNSNLNPELGLAVTSNSIVGLLGGFSTSTTKDNSGNKMTNNSYSAGLFWKRLFSINDKVGWFGDLSGSYDHSKYTTTSMLGSKQEASANGFSASLSPGVYYKPGRKIFLTAGIGGLSYNHSRTGQSSSNPVTYNSFNVSLLNYFTFGVSFILNKEHQM